MQMYLYTHFTLMCYYKHNLPPLRVTLKFIYIWAECQGDFYCQDDLEEWEDEVEQM